MRHNERGALEWRVVFAIVFQVVNAAFIVLMVENGFRTWKLAIGVVLVFCLLESIIGRLSKIVFSPEWDGQ